MVFYQRIGDALKWSDPKTAVQLDILERHLVLRWLADGVPFEHLVKLVDTLKEATRLGEGAWTAPPLTEKSRWIDALGAAKDYHRAYGEAASYPPPNPRHRSVAAGIKRLRQEGVRVEVRDGF